VRPNKSYLSLYKGKGRGNRLLFFLFATQVLLLSLLRITIPIPVKFAEKLLEDYETKGISFDVEQVALSFPDEITVSKLVILKDGHKTAVVNELKIQYPFFKLPWGEWKDLKGVYAKSIALHAIAEAQPCLRVDDLSIQRKKNEKHFLSAFIHSNHSFLNMKGSFDFDYLKSLFEATPEKQHHFELSDSMDRVLSYVDELRSALKQTGTLHLQSFVNGSPNGELNLSQWDGGRSEPIGNLRGLRAVLQISTQDDKPHVASLKAELKDLSIRRESIVTILRDLSFSNPSIKFQHLNTLRNNFGESSLRIGEIELRGKMEGRLPAFSIISNSAKGLEEGMFFSDSNRTKVALGYQCDSLVSLHGEAHFTPKSFDLYCNTKKGRLRVIDGDECTLTLFRNEAYERAVAPMHFRATTPRLSVMETPDGAFSLKGMIAPDYSISVNSAWGKMGRCEVTGSYSQSWFPHNFRFLLKGECLPTDINNWLGSWWKSFWTDFSFGETTPWGDFSISGDWGSFGTDTISYGMVRTQKLSYRNLAVSKSSILVESDSNQTSVRAIIRHKEGQLQGNLSFPRNTRSMRKLLSFDFNGDYPLDTGRKAFGPEVERHLTDFNATNLLCEASGSIFKPLNDASGESNETNYKIKISTDQNASLWNIPTEYIHGGEITYKNLVTKGEFPSIGLGNGKATLEFTLGEDGENHLLDFDFDLKGAERTALVAAMSKVRVLDQDSRKHIMGNVESTKDSTGKIDLSIHAKGPVDDFLQFKGGGHIRLVEKNLQKVNLLGEISERLDAIKLPIPSGSFSFEMLEIPFSLEYDQIYSDKILLTGPLSRLEADGRLNLVSGEIDVTSRLKLIGNLKIPILKKIINAVDPLSKITKIRIYGDWKDPKTHFVTPLDKILRLGKGSK
jgi:hypothetical protein